MGEHARRRDTPEQISRKLEADRLLGEGLAAALVAKQLEVPEQTLHRWRLQYGGLRPTTRSGWRSLSVRTGG